MQLCGDLWLLFFAGWILAAFWTKRTAERVSSRRQMYYAIPVLAGFYLLLSSRWEFARLDQRILPRNGVLEIAGLIMTVAGMAFAVWARVHLGSNWSSAPMIKEHHQLVRSGPYRWVRHPIYTGLLLSSCGTFLVNGKVRGALGVALLYLAFVIKSRIEEEFMGRTFGSEYEDYRRSTGGIIPRLLG
jgi:protein-S-isoprenylcysteine O-methyltransferase Ste14